MCVQVQRCEEFPYVSMAPSREPPQRLCQVSDVRKRGHSGHSNLVIVYLWKVPRVMRGNEVQLHIGNLLLRDSYKKQLYISQTEWAKALYDSVHTL